MSDENRNDDGQFAPAEPVFGREQIERDAGYVPYKEEAPADSEELTLEEAVEQTESSTPQSDIKTYSALDELPDNVSLTLEQAVKLQTEMDAADTAQSELEEAEKLRAEVDKLRGEAEENKASAEENQIGKDPKADVEKFLALPHVKEAVEKLTGEAEQTRSAYQNGLTAATAIAQATFFSQFPEFADIPEGQQAQALAIMQQNDPARAAKVYVAVQNFASLAEQHRAEQQRIDHEKHSRLATYAKEEGDRFEKMISDVPKSQRKAIEDGIVAKIKEYGGDMQQFVRLMKSTEFASATVQRLLWDVGRLHQIENARKAVASNALPPVQRPGVSRSRSSSDDDIAALDRELTRTGSIKVAQKLMAAKMRARG